MCNLFSKKTPPQNKNQANNNKNDPPKYLQLPSWKVTVWMSVNSQECLIGWVANPFLNLFCIQSSEQETAKWLSNSDSPAVTRSSKVPVSAQEGGGGQLIHKWHCCNLSLYIFPFSFLFWPVSTDESVKTPVLLCPWKESPVKHSVWMNLSLTDAHFSLANPTCWAGWLLSQPFSGLNVWGGLNKLWLVPSSNCLLLLFFISHHLHIWW